MITLITLPETNSNCSHLRMDGTGRWSFPFWMKGPWQVLLLLVSGSLVDQSSVKSNHVQVVGVCLIRRWCFFEIRENPPGNHHPLGCRNQKLLVKFPGISTYQTPSLNWWWINAGIFSRSKLGDLECRAPKLVAYVRASTLQKPREVHESLKNLYGGFLKWWYPQIIHFNGSFHYKPSILGYPYFWKRPYRIWANHWNSRSLNVLDTFGGFPCDPPTFGVTSAVWSL